MSMFIPKAQIIAALLLFFIFTSSTHATFDWVQQEFLKAHNDLRASVGVPPLQWDANLASSAQSWALQLKQTCNYRQHSTNPYGENIFWELYRQTSASSVVQKWFSEKQFFNHATNLCQCQPERPGCQCGHYLNVIWKTTTKVGCSGYVYCNDQKGAIVVCSYDPIGNVKGVNPLNPGNNAGVTSPSVPPQPINTGNVQRARDRKRNVTSPVPITAPLTPRQHRRGKGRGRGKGRRNNRN